MGFSGVFALLISCAGLSAQTASFGGIAVNSVNGQPLSGVHLKLVTVNVGGVVENAFGALSGRDGRFSVTGVPPGTYLLLTERTGFVHMMTVTGAVPLPSITLKAGERMADYRLELTPRAVIAVRVCDEYGDPVPNATLEATLVTTGDPVAAGTNMGRRVSTNLMGEGRITGGPGKFHVKATPAAAPAQAAEIRTDGASDATYGPTWYPSATSADRASVVEVAAGADAAIEIRLVRQRSITIGGTVSGIPPDSPAFVSLLSGDRPDRLVNTRSVSVGPEGGFRFSKLPPTYYRVTAFVSRPKLQSQSVDVKPDSPETVGVQLALTAGAQLTGTVEIAGDRPDAPVEKRTVTLGSATATSESDGSFKIGEVFPDRYSVGVQPLPDNGYVKSVDLDGIATAEPVVDLTRVTDGSRLKITLARDGAQLSGAVLDKDGQPLGNTVAIVILAPDREHIPLNQNGMVKEGKYSLKGIRPGKYLLFAIDAFRSGPSNDEGLRKLAARAEEIEIKAGDRINKDVKLLLKEDGDAGKKQ